MRFLKHVLATLVGLATWSGITAAQCPLPDQLDGGPCCAPAQDKLPNFPNFSQPSLEICWRDCNVNAVLPYVAKWTNVNLGTGSPGTPFSQPCGERVVKLELRSGTVLHWTGNMRFVYSRTWMETDSSGFPIQVWRFLLNGDLTLVTTAAPIPCPVPPCAPAHGNRVRFTGYMDQARSCAIVPATFQRAWMLTHACDMIDHVPGLPRGGAFHPDRSYSFVGPSAGFVPAPLQPIEGTPGSPFEALRRRNLFGPPAGLATCEFEERAQFNLVPNNQLCLCGVPTTTQWLIANANILGACGTTLTTPGPILPGYLSMGIGSWTAPGTFPGVESLRWNAASYNYFNPCTGATSPEVFFGVTTSGGFAAQQLLSGPAVGLPLPPFFIDQANSLAPPTGPGLIMNVPYVSDKILNLNHP